MPEDQKDIYFMTGETRALMKRVVSNPLQLMNPQDKQSKGDKQDKPIPEAKVWTSRHQIRLGGKAIDYLSF